MQKTIEQGGPKLNRRNFLTATGLAATAFVMPNFLAGCSSYAANPGVISVAELSASSEEMRISTDVLVIGGGMAGAFAAVRAKKAGLDVTLVDKGTVGRSGATPWANTFSVFDEAAGDDRDEWISGVRSSSEYVNNLDWLDQMLDESKARWEEINEWGMLDDNVQHPSLVLRDKLLDSGVNLVERTMITTLLTQEDSGERRVVGAMGFTLDGEAAVTILANATIMAAGAGSFKAPGFPIQSLTSDGDAMAYRVGAVISGKEWIDFHFTSAENPASCWSQWSRMWDSGVGKMNQVFTAGMTLDSAFAVHTGEEMQSSGPGGPPADSGSSEDGERPSGPPPRAEDGEEASDPPAGQSEGEQVLGAATGLGIHKAEGVWPINMQGASNIPGLYAAGDGLASMLCGSSYVGLGFSLSGSAVQGVAVGDGAAGYASSMPAPTMSDDEIGAAQAAMYAPRERESGFSPAWVTQVLQNTMFPYYVLFVKEQSRLEAALSTITFLREHIVPQLTAQDAHELKLAHETANMLLNAEMKLRASLYRTESRGTHYREEYPARNDDEWLAWVLLQMDADGQMAVTKNRFLINGNPI